MFLLELPDAESCPNALHFFCPDPIHLFLDHDGKAVAMSDLASNFPQCLAPDRPGWFMDLDEQTLALLPALLDKSQTLAGKKAERMQQESLDRMKQILGKEQTRLAALARTNPGITEREIAAAGQEEAHLSRIMARAALRLDAVRVIRLSPSP